MASYYAAVTVFGLAILGAVVLPRLLSDRPISFPLLFIGGGALVFTLPIGLTPPQPLENPQQAEQLTELVVIIALMGAGLKLDRPFDWRAWRSTWRLLGIAMPITIALTTVLAWQYLGAHIATAVLMGAVIAPTDPVLAADVQTGPPVTATDEEVDPAEQEGTVRFALTSEAGLNDGLAFPFTYLAIALAAAVGLESSVWVLDWFLVDVVYKIAMGGVVGYVLGKVLARFVFGRHGTTKLAQVMAGAEALAATLLSYGLTELLHGYGFIAVFVTALVLRHHEWEHPYYEELHEFAVIVERLLMAVVLLLFGGAIAGGLLAPLTLEMVVVGIVIILVVRPLSGLISMIGFPALWRERAVISAFGIRGIGSFYYLAYALNQASFQEMELLIAADRLWALVGFVVLASSVLHGITATPVMGAIDRWRKENTADFDPQRHSEAD
jgi:NhaP-type Na+/H+ or K+/H+ antiporter